MKMKRSAMELQAEIHRRLRDRRGIEPECRDCRVNLPRAADPAYFGGNWTTELLAGPLPCSAAVDTVIREVRQEFDLAL